ncbi:hypothetical protein GW755_03445 [bacterium]|nr:hypothetical protein [bacterium]
MLPNIFHRKNHTLENFYRYSYLFTSFIFLFISLTVYGVYLPVSRIFSGAFLTPFSLQFIFWVNILLFLDSLIAAVAYGRFKLWGVWRYKNIILFFYVGAIIIFSLVFVFNYLLTPIL